MNPTTSAPRGRLAAGSDTALVILRRLRSRRTTCRAFLRRLHVQWDDKQLFLRTSRPQDGVVFNLVRDSPIVPTFALGGGLTYRDTWGYSDPEDPRVGDKPDIDALVNAGIGLNLQIAGPLHLRTDFRYMLSIGGPGSPRPTKPTSTPTGSSQADF